MDSSRFDRWTRLLGGQRDRRTLLGLVAAATGAAISPGLAGAVDDREAEARANGKGKGKGKGKKKKCRKKQTRCGAKCVDLKTDRKHCGSCKTRCGATTHCQNGVCTPNGPACGTGAACIVFVSSAVYDGNLGNLFGADTKCNNLAAAASLPGTWKAWLSDASASAAGRLVHNPGPYRLVDGTTVAANWSVLTSGTLEHAINLDENHATVTDIVWTSTVPNGGLDTQNGYYCNNWGNNVPAVWGNTGNSAATDSTWTDESFYQCDSARRLYCVQQSS